jgi:hypothetical protein
MPQQIYHRWKKRKMISNVSCSANAIATQIADAHPSAYPDASASRSETAEFFDQIACLESRLASEAKAQKAPETSDDVDDADDASNDMADAASVPSRPDRRLAEDAKTIADINGIMIPALPLPLPIPTSIPSIDTTLAPVIDIPAIPEASEVKTGTGVPAIGIDPISMNDEAPDTSMAPAAIARNTIEPSMPFSGRAGDVRGARDSKSISPTITPSDNKTIGAEAIAGTANDATASLSVGGTQVLQALVSEFETSINHFERTGNQWVGSAKIVFQSNVLNGASVQITGDGKSLNILLTQSAQSSPIALLSRQEKQLCDTLTRRLGRVVTFHVQQAFETQAADDTEPQ